MTTNQTIDGVRKLAEQACGTSPDSPAYRRFIAAMNPTLLLDLTARAAQPQGEPVAMSRDQFEAWVLGREHPTYGWLDKHWLTRGDNPDTYANEYVQGLWVASQTLYAEQPAPDIKLHVNVSNVKVTVNADGSYSIDPVEAPQACCGSCPGGCVYGLKA